VKNISSTGRCFSFLQQKEEIKMKDVISQSEFTAVVVQAIESGELTREDIAVEFGIGLCTVGRWETGKSMPQSYAVPVVMTFLVSKLPN
jgi:DNA-binding transcriptional regulator YiaG